MNSSRFPTWLSIALATFAFIPFATAGEPTGDVAAMKKIESLQREAQALYPHGRLQATIRSVNLFAQGEMEAKIDAYWDGDRTRTEAQIVSDRPDRERPSSFRLIHLTRGGQNLQFADPPKLAFVAGQPEHPPKALNYLACMPLHCWFGGDEASGRPWTWFLERYDEADPVNRTTHTTVEDSFVTIRQIVRKEDDVVGDLTAVFDLDISGMCVSFERESLGIPCSGTLNWTVDGQGRPVLQTLNWKRTLLSGQTLESELTIESFEPGFFIDETKLSFDLAQFPVGMQIVDERVRPTRTFRVEPGVTLDESPVPAQPQKP